MNTKPELLAPAGGMAQLKAAVRFGADAVYLGAARYGLRAFAGNFDEPQLKEATRFAHAHGVRVYVTVNAFLYDDDLEGAAQTLRMVHSLGADAAIVSDLATVLMARREAPGLPIHISTQANTLNHMAALHYHELGAERIILARELSLERIANLRARLPKQLALESFMHGAMCASYSGRCVLSNHLSGRDANQGACAQPCRWRYALVEEKRPGKYLPIAQDEHGTYVYSAQDLCMIDHIGDLMRAGISSLKIEGRMKSEYYVATVVRAYRSAIDQAWENPSMPFDTNLLEEVCKASHRPFGTGFYYGIPDSPPSSAEYTQSAQFIAAVLENQNGRILLEQRNRFFEGEVLTALTPKGLFPLTVMDLRTEEGSPQNAAPHPRQRLTIRCDLPLEAGDLLRRDGADHSED